MINNVSIQEFYHIFSTHCFTPLILKPSIITSHSASVIDNISTNTCIDHVYSSALFATRAYSEHFPIFVY